MWHYCIVGYELPKYEVVIANFFSTSMCLYEGCWWRRAWCLMKSVRLLRVGRFILKYLLNIRVVICCAVISKKLLTLTTGSLTLCESDKSTYVLIQQYIEMIHFCHIFVSVPCFEWLWTKHNANNSCLKSSDWQWHRGVGQLLTCMEMGSQDMGTPHQAVLRTTCTRILRSVHTGRHRHRHVLHIIVCRSSAWTQTERETHDYCTKMYSVSLSGSVNTQLVYQISPYTCLYVYMSIQVSISLS